mmetsp:Transcript_73514/g.153385  ORF Transcript_73514/g.153385 Transcript_73514/m.153385 type:complete len:80 (-) Transcript_73514:100-339(-)
MSSSRKAVRFRKEIVCGEVACIANGSLPLKKALSALSEHSLGLAAWVIGDGSPLNHGRSDVAWLPIDNFVAWKFYWCRC